MDNNSLELNEEVKEPVTAPAAELTEEELRILKKKKWLNIWDKFTTGLLIFLMASPFLILFYIFFWFIVLQG